MIRAIVFGCLIAITLAANKETCDYKGKLYKKGDAFMDDCNHCFCGGNNMVGCTKMWCKSHKAESYVNLEVSKDTCEHKGKLYKEGDRFMDDCNHCFCGGNNIVRCTKMMCRPHYAEQYKNLEDNVAEEKTCTQNGKTYKQGDRFMNDCNRCFCGVNGNIGCTQMLCIHPEKNQYSDSETCTKNGKVYKKGDNFSLDGCNMCFCGGNDMIGCTKKLCPPKGCYHEGKLYKLGENFKKDCNRCICTKNGGICTAMACLPKSHGI